MNGGVELHDSKVRAIEESGSSLRISFDSAYVHQSEGRLGIDPGAGYVQQAELVFADATCEGLSARCAGGLSEGFLALDGVSYSIVPVPFAGAGKVEAELMFVSGAVLKVAAGSMSFTVHGTPRYVETLAA